MAKESYKQFLKRTLTGMIDRLDLDEFRKDALKSRWLDQLLWLESNAGKAKKRFYTLRLVTIVGGVITPALVSLNSGRFREAFLWSAFGMSQAVAISAAVEELFGFSGRYRTFRNTAEGMKVEGWQYFQLTGQYSYYRSHSAAYIEFTGRVEAMIKQDIEGYMAQVQQAEESTRHAREQAREIAATTTAVTIEQLNQILEEKERQRQITAAREIKQPEQSQPEAANASTDASQVASNGNGNGNGNSQPQGDLSIWDNVIDIPPAKPQSTQVAVVQAPPVQSNGTHKGRKLNVAGMKILKECEGLYLNAYKCPAGVWTIGFGCTEGVRPGMSITEAEAEQMLRKELAKFEEGVERTLGHIPLNENQFSALVSLTYNCGLGAISEGMTIRRKLEARDYQGAADGFLLWNKGGGRVLPGLVKRREMERKLFLTEV
jgi:GH24 family phage-related lysozyme (muramidase)